MSRLVFFCLVWLISTGVAGERIADPFEAVNRKSHNLNAATDERFMRPMASGYNKIVPPPIKQAIRGVYGNLRDCGDAINNFLQGKPEDFLSDVVRISLNTTLGLGGIFDPAKALGFKDHDEDFAQTLAKWGVPRGPYLVLPLLGPSSVRDVFAGLSNSLVDPLRYLRPYYHRKAVYAARLVDTRAKILDTEKVVFGDRYLFFREAYLQRRRYLELDGLIFEDPFSDDFDDF